MVRELLKETAYADKADCIAQTLERFNLHHGGRWENAPIRTGSTICGEDVYRVIAALNETYLQEAEDVPTLQEEEEPEEEEEGTSIFTLTERGISEARVQKIASAGIMTVEKLQALSKKERSELLESLDDIGEKTAQKIENVL